jgi:molybdate transport system permease protein
VDFEALKLSLLLATLTTLVLLAAGLPIAQWVATTRWRFKVLIEAVVALPLVLPPTVLGFYLLVAMGPHSPLGQAWISLVGRPLAFSFEGLLVASVIYSLPFAVQPFAASLIAVDRRLVEASYSLGVSPLKTFFRVSLPLAAPGVAAGAVLTFAHALGEFGVVLMVGGSIPGRTKVISIAVFENVETLDYSQAHVLSAGLLVFSFLLLLLIFGLNRRLPIRYPA